MATLNGTLTASPATGATFDPALPTYKDHVRLALGDTDVATPLLVDSTIDAKLGLFSYSEAVAQLAEALISQFAQKPSDYTDKNGVSIKWSERVKAWRELVLNCRASAVETPSAVRPAAKGICIGLLTAPDKTTFRSD